MPLGLLVIDHGSRRDASNRQLEDIAAILRAMRPHDVVQAAHMEIAEPDIAGGFRMLVERGVERIYALPYFLSDGRHVDSDVPCLLAEAAEPFPEIAWSMGGALGPDPLLAELLLKRVGLHPAG